MLASDILGGVSYVHQLLLALEVVLAIHVDCAPGLLINDIWCHFSPI